jgi:hypothetical protein
MVFAKLDADIVHSSIFLCYKLENGETAKMPSARPGLPESSTPNIMADVRHTCA